MPRLLAAAGLSCALLLGAVAAPATAFAAPAADPAQAPAGAWVLDHRHASLIVRISHFGTSNYTMRFDKLTGAYAYDPAKPLATKVEITVDPTSINTGLPDFDKEIAEDPKFFDAKKFPTITFVSSKLEQTAPGKGKLTGDLTFHGVTKPVVLDVTYNGFAKSPLGAQMMGFSATTSFNRSDFGVKYGIPMVSDRVDLVIEAEFNPKK